MQAAGPEQQKDDAEDGDAAAVNITASSMIEVLAGKVNTLHGITSALEDALSVSLCECSPMTRESAQSFQRVDFLRQSLQDIESILLYVSQHMSWHEDSSVTVDGLLHAVNMRDSLKDIVHSLPQDANHGGTESNASAGQGVETSSSDVEYDDDIWM
ncbi:hypothetical protein DI396_04400 [Litorivita pollutaquae]|uniref:Uncharacterized protein n=1 Tax=Litorivita pollutaquae TaxID=2200892 RepID=A0A2V4NTK2_9RHOB|nr:hypothetical protein [Litorivita pollutaquae]PYC48246.1 hypothetical protein DI396_04400 [Litorivita pollutaquae]